MSKFDQYIPNTSNAGVRGDDRDLPTHDESSFATDSYGADLGPEATNKKGKISAATQSDDIAKQCADPGLI